MADDEEYAGEEGQHAGSDNEYIGDYFLVVWNAHNELDGELIILKSPVKFQNNGLLKVPYFGFWLKSFFASKLFRLIIGAAFILSRISMILLQSNLDYVEYI